MDGFIVYRSSLASKTVNTSSCIKIQVLSEVKIYNCGIAIKWNAMQSPKRMMDPAFTDMEMPMIFFFGTKHMYRRNLRKIGSIIGVTYLKVYERILSFLYISLSFILQNRYLQLFLGIRNTLPSGTGSHF